MVEPYGVLWTLTWVGYCLPVIVTAALGLVAVVWVVRR